MTELFSDLDLKKFLNEIGDNWFLLTNNINLLEMSGKLPFSYSKCFGYMKGVFGLIICFISQTCWSQTAVNMLVPLPLKTNQCII